MDAKDWYQCGAKIGDLVQSAIDSNDFKQLSQTIMDTIGSTLDAAQESMRSAGMAGRRRADGTNTYRNKGFAYQKARDEANLGDLMDIFTSRKNKQTRSGDGSAFVKNGKGLFSMIAGYAAAAASGITALAFWFVTWMTGWTGFHITAGILTLLAAVFALIGARGGSYRSRVKQLEQYLKLMDGRDTITIEELASGSGKSVKAVTKDLKRMIRDGMFAAGAYLDAEETTLMTSHQAYRQYQDTMKAYRQRKEEVTREQRRAAEKDLASYSDETRTILNEGQAFINHIHESNDKIADVEMSLKLERLEQVVSRIFDQVAKKPESAPDMHRMMSYYLPITQKLIDAYEELGGQQIGGENIDKTKQEIEMSLDTINTAFEAFLDSFYQDTAWDISSDISTLKTMMARDGLTGGQAMTGSGRIKTVAGDVAPRMEASQAQAAAGGGAAAAAIQPAAGQGAAAALQEEQ